MTRGRVALLLGLTLLALAAAWVYDNVTLEEVRIPAEPKGEAARNVAAAKPLRKQKGNAQN